MPFWDVNECVKEVHRAASLGHKSILACSEPQAFGEPDWRTCTGIPSGLQ
jgi:hypothetical protein